MTRVADQTWQKDMYLVQVLEECVHAYEVHAALAFAYWQLLISSDLQQRARN